MKALAVTAYRRPEYTRRVLSALSSCRGFSDYYVILCVDHFSDEVTEGIVGMGQAFCVGARSLECYAHKTHAGCNRNVRTALRFCFEDRAVDFAAVIEDDVLVSPDALALLDWMSCFGADKSLFTAGLWRAYCGYGSEPASDADPRDQGGREMLPDERYRLTTQSGFRPWGWGTWRDRWEEFDARWASDDDRGDSWDFNLGRVAGDRKQLLPLISRATNIGAADGTHRGAAELPVWMGNLPPAGYPLYVGQS